MSRPLQHIAIALLVAGMIAACARSELGLIASGAGDVPIQQEENRLQEILERGSLRVGTTGEYYLSRLDTATGKRSGFDIDLMHKFASDMGVEVEFVSTDWSSLVSGLTAGRYDITTGASYTAGRARLASYTIPVATTGTVALIRESDAELYTSWNRLNQPDVVVAVQRGSMVEEYARDLVPEATISVIEPPAVVYDEIVSGRADVALATVIDAAEHLAAGSPLIAAPVEPRNANFIGLLVRQGDTELRAYADAWIRAQDVSGFLTELTARHRLDF